jgi:hypothetical protein
LANVAGAVRLVAANYDALITKQATLTVAGETGAWLMVIVNFPVPAEAFFT